MTGADAMRCNVLFCLTDAQCQKYRTVLRPLLERDRAQRAAEAEKH